jgi:hypothetical protein
MKTQLELRYQWSSAPMGHHDRLLLIGSCFTANIGAALAERGFRTLANPTGIVFDPTAVARHLQMLAQGESWPMERLFYANELWNSWEHHSDFSHTSREAAVEAINSAIRQGHQCLKSATWLVLTLGSAFRYQLVDSAQPVANNHRAPSTNFTKQLLSVEGMLQELKAAIQAARNFNPQLKVLFTVSPVRHHRDGVIDNNRSKARLIEVVHLLVEEVADCHYFPAYELVIDVLRDHRWYDIDLVHPNHAATQYVFEQFSQLCMDDATRELAANVYELTLASRHRPRFPDTEAHRRFIHETAQKREKLALKLPWLLQTSG